MGVATWDRWCHTVPMATATDTTTCTGNVRGTSEHRDVPTDSAQWRTCHVHITRCTACHGSATVEDTYTGERWLVQLPADYARDDAMAAYWAVEVSQHMEPVYRPEPEATTDPACDVQDWADWEDAYVEDEDGSQAFARMLERRAEQGTWWG